jgi:hypothetical protein
MPRKKIEYQPDSGSQLRTLHPDVIASRHSVTGQDTFVDEFDQLTVYDVSRARAVVPK